MTYLKRWNKNFSVFSRIFPPQKAVPFLLWNALPLFIQFFPMILGKLTKISFGALCWVLYVGQHPGSRVFLESAPLWLCLEQALIWGKPLLLGCYPTQKSNSKQFVLLMERGTYVETLNQSQPAHHGGWMVFGQETLFHWIPVQY